MADLSDVTAYLAQQAASAVYPNGDSQSSVANMDTTVFEGWPLGDQLDLDMAGNMKDPTDPAGSRVIPRPGGPVANVSVFPMPGTGVGVYQILDQTYVISAAAVTTTVAVNGEVITVSGSLSAGEFLTVIIDDAVICSQTGANVQAMLAALAAQAQAHGYAATSTANTLTVPFGHSMVVRQGGQALMGKVTHRQRHSVMITVWAPNRVVRNLLAGAIDVALKKSNKVTLPDTSQALVIYNRTMVSDQEQASNIYRRDLIYDVEYATLETFPGYTITSTTVSIEKMDSTAVATAIT